MPFAAPDWSIAPSFSRPDCASEALRTVPSPACTIEADISAHPRFPGRYRLLTVLRRRLRIGTLFDRRFVVGRSLVDGSRIVPGPFPGKCGPCCCRSCTARLDRRFAGGARALLADLAFVGAAVLVDLAQRGFSWATVARLRPPGWVTLALLPVSPPCRPCSIVARFALPPWSMSTVSVPSALPRPG